MTQYGPKEEKWVVDILCNKWVICRTHRSSNGLLNEKDGFNNQSLRMGWISIYFDKRITLRHTHTYIHTLSPIIFAIFLIQHIFNKYPDVNYNLYADDIKLHSNIESSDQLQNCLTDLHNWLTTNDLLLNSTKTELINISAAKLNIEPAFPKIFINDIPIKPYNSTKYLGIIWQQIKLWPTHSLTETDNYLPFIQPI